MVYLICMDWKNLYNSYQQSVLCTCTYVIAMYTYICSFMCISCIYYNVLLIINNVLSEKRIIIIMIISN